MLALAMRIITTLRYFCRLRLPRLLLLYVIFECYDAFAAPMFDAMWLLSPRTAILSLYARGAMPLHTRSFAERYAAACDIIAAFYAMRHFRHAFAAVCHFRGYDTVTLMPPPDA